MMDAFKELLRKKAKEQGAPKDCSHKASAMKELSDMLKGDTLESLKGLKKVTVASDSEEGLKSGLEKAEDILEKKDEEQEPSEEMQDEEGPEDLETEIAKLEEELQKLKARKA